MGHAMTRARAPGHADAALRQEFFSAESDASGGVFGVELARSGRTVTVAEGRSIVAALAGVGVKVEVSCEQGICGACPCDVLDGEPDRRDSFLTPEEKAEGDQMTLCCSRALGAAGAGPVTMQAPIPGAAPASARDVEEFRGAMARLGAAATIVTTDGPMGRRGLTVSAVCSVTDAPPGLLVCANRRAAAHDALLANGAFCVNAPCHARADPAMRFGRPGLAPDDRFAGACWSALVTDAPAPEGGSASLHRRVDHVRETGGHSVTFAEIAAIRLTDCAEGLVWFDSDCNRLGAAARCSPAEGCRP